MTDREILLSLEAAIDRMGYGLDRARVARLTAKDLVPEVKQLIKEALAASKRDNQ